MRKTVILLSIVFLLCFQNAFAVETVCSVEHGEGAKLYEFCSTKISLDDRVYSYVFDRNQNYSVQIIDLNTGKTQVSQPAKFSETDCIFEQIVNLGSDVFLFFHDKDGLFYHNINTFNGTILATKTYVNQIGVDRQIENLFFLPRRVSFDNDRVREGAGSANLEIGREYNFIMSKSRDRLLVTYHDKLSEERSSSRLNDVLNLLLFDRSMKQLFGKKLELPYQQKSLRYEDIVLNHDEVSIGISVFEKKQAPRHELLQYDFHKGYLVKKSLNELESMSNANRFNIVLGEGNRPIAIGVADGVLFTYDVKDSRYTQLAISKEMILDYKSEFERSEMNALFAESSIPVVPDLVPVQLVDLGNGAFVYILQEMHVPVQETSILLGSLKDNEKSYNQFKDYYLLHFNAMGKVMEAFKVPSRSQDWSFIMNRSSETYSFLIAGNPININLGKKEIPRDCNKSNKEVMQYIFSARGEFVKNEVILPTTSLFSVPVREWTLNADFWMNDFEELVFITPDLQSTSTTNGDLIIKFCKN